MLVKLGDTISDLHEYRHGNGKPSGYTYGLQQLEQLYRPEKGYLSVWTGIPSHGKSEVLDAIIVNLSIVHGWKHVVFSPENHPVAIHFEKLAEKYIGKTMFMMTEDEYTRAMTWIDEHFTFIDVGESACTPKFLMEQISEAKALYGCDNVVIDPWNDLQHEIDKGLSETIYINNTLTDFRKFARANNIHLNIVAHPTKMQKDKKGNYMVPTPYDISGSAAWRNRADFCITVHRHDLTKNEPCLYVQKVKYKFFGKIGEQQLWYEYQTGRIKDSAYAAFVLPHE